MAANKSIIFGF